MKFPHPFRAVGDCICPLRMQTSSRGIKGDLFHTRKFVVFEGHGWKGNRLSYHLNVASIPKKPESEDGYVLHDCGNDWCINPEHLYLGTLKQNAADCYRHIPDMRQRLSKSARMSWSNPERVKRQSKSLSGNKNALGKRWKLDEQTKEKMRRGWTDERRSAQATRMANLNRSRAK